MLRTLATIGGTALILTALVDCFNTIMLPRRVRRLFLLIDIFYRLTWIAFSAVARRIADGRRREEWLSIYGPLSLMSLLGLWVVSVVAGFGLLQWAESRRGDAANAMKVSASAIVTIAHTQPASPLSQWLVPVEAAVGFALFGLVVGYLPMLYQSYSRRGMRISMLDARAGSPPASGELLVRQGRNPEKLETQLAEWENWMAELLEQLLSYPMLGYFRSQHQNQSWL